MWVNSNTLKIVHCHSNKPWRLDFPNHGHVRVAWTFMLWITLRQPVYRQYWLQDIDTLIRLRILVTTYCIVGNFQRSNFHHFRCWMANCKNQSCKTSMYICGCDGTIAHVWKITRQNVRRLPIRETEPLSRYTVTWHFQSSTKQCVFALIFDYHLVRSICGKCFFLWLEAIFSNLAFHLG